MPKPYIHAELSAKQYGGVPDDYLDIHNLMDSSKSVFPNNLHRALTHHSWFIFILEKIFGVTRVNSDGKIYSVRDIGESHCLQDFGGRFVPSPQDYLEHLELKNWMCNMPGDIPSSYRKIWEKNKNSKIDKEKQLEQGATGVPETEQVPSVGAVDASQEHRGIAVNAVLDKPIRTKIPVEDNYNKIVKRVLRD